MHYFGQNKTCEIRKIETNTTQWVGLKASTATKGLVIHFNKYDEIFIAPVNTKLFIDSLLKINPDIELVNKSNY